MDHRELLLPSHGDPSPPAAAYPRWVLLEQSMWCQDPDARTVAYTHTSTGHPFRISFAFPPPPAVSRPRFDFPGRGGGIELHPFVIAAHGDSVLVQIQTEDYTTVIFDERCTVDYFVYSAGDAPARPPSLSRLPPCYLTKQEEGRRRPRERFMGLPGMTLLRRQEDDETVVAALDARTKEEGPVLEAELCLLRRSGGWELKRLPVLHDKGKRRELSCWVTDAAAPVGDRFLCWVDYFRGVIFSDVSRESPELRYVSLPVKPDLTTYYRDGRGGSSYRSVCATGGGGMVMSSPARCCGGGPGTTDCARSHHAFTITMWTLDMNGMTWDKARYAGVIPRVKPEYPTVSLDDPDVLCLVVHKRKYHREDVDGDRLVRLIEVDTRRMELRSVSRYGFEYLYTGSFLSCAVSQYFNTLSVRGTPDRRARPHLGRPTHPRVLRLAPPPAASRLRADIPGCADNGMTSKISTLVIAAHGDSVLLGIETRN
ncbi:hypothetical protein BRADI_1g58252v3 [Brachypodium distachyon]|uniref:DUF1618 domain-containing protein n=1 Tax=Brachypodium distachyon TaxID=15368 RepID=A0A0Q3JTU0_BRADI|nr:hypothetical protein BRADI_1g58252v3 [Brachypodium distachyon]